MEGKPSLGSTGSLRAGAPSWFDGLTGDETPPLAAAAAALDDFAWSLRETQHWTLETGCGGVIALSIASHEPGKRLVLRLALATATGEGVVTLLFAPDLDGWLRVVACRAEHPLWQARLDRPYEEYELRPDGWNEPPGVEPPGRIGKRRNWINLDLAAWPQLARFANAHGIVAACETEPK